jgi:hypothetical protein
MVIIIKAMIVFMLCSFFDYISVGNADVKINKLQDQMLSCMASSTGELMMMMMVVVVMMMMMMMMLIVVTMMTIIIMITKDGYDYEDTNRL